MTVSHLRCRTMTISSRRWHTMSSIMKGHSTPFVKPQVVSLSVHVCLLYNIIQHATYHCIGVDFGRSPGTCPSIIEKRPCIYHFLPPFAPPISSFAHPIFLTSLRQ